MQLYEKAPCGYLSTDPDGLIVKVNQTFLLWTGYGRNDLVGKRTFADLLSVGARIYHETHLAPLLLMQGRAREIALDLVRADGQRLPVLINAVLEYDEHHAPRVVRIAVFDATERRAYERELLLAKQRAEESEARARQLARTLQRSFLPPTAPRVPHLDVAGVYRAAAEGDEVGGDFFDVFQVGNEEWMVVLGDVCGKGVGAAVVTALVRHTIRALAVGGSSPRKMLTDLNAVLLDQEPDRFCTVVLAQMTRSGSNWTIRVCVAGHPLPVLIRQAGRPCEFGTPGILLGAFDEVELQEAELHLDAGDALLLYTDGITEAKSSESFYGVDRLLVAAQRHRGSATSLTNGLFEEVMTFQGGVARDDVALLAIQAQGTSQGNTSLLIVDDTDAF
ncbi:MAG: PP2C family protein-serine/threonine phosphatase [Nocardioidaceae bacterium]